MNQRIQSYNCFLLFACVSAFMLYVISILLIALTTQKLNDFSKSMKYVIFPSQVFICVYCFLGGVVLWYTARYGSHWYSSRFTSQLCIKIFAVIAVAFLILAALATIFQLDNFLYFGMMLLFDTYISALMSFSFWHRKQTIDLYIELIVKSNQNNKSVLSEQDARNVFKLCQYENLHKVFQQSFQEQSIVNSVSHPEYFYIQRWIVRLNDFLDGEADADVLQDLKNDMMKRAERLGLDKKYQERYRHLAWFRDLIIPTDGDEKHIKREDRINSF